MNRFFQSQKSRVLIAISVVLGTLIAGCSDQPQMNRPSDICNQGIDLISDFPQEASGESLADYKLKVKDFFDSSMPSEARDLLDVYLDSIGVASKKLDSLMSIDQGDPSYEQAASELSISWEKMTDDANTLFNYCSSING